MTLRDKCNWYGIKDECCQKSYNISILPELVDDIEIAQCQICKRILMRKFVIR